MSKIDTKKSRKILRQRSARKLSLYGEDIEIVVDRGSRLAYRFVDLQVEDGASDSRAIIHAVNDAEKWLDKIDSLETALLEIQGWINSYHDKITNNAATVQQAVNAVKDVNTYLGDADYRISNALNGDENEKS